MRKQPSFCKILFFLLLIPLISHQGLLAQKQEIDAVYLKNGDVYRGSLQNSEITGKLILETLCSNRMNFDLDDIAHLSREFISRWEYYEHDTPVENGFFNRTDIGALIGSGMNNQNLVFSVHMVNGYKYRSRLYAGIGSGIEFYEQAHVPLYSDISYFISRGRLSPFVRASGGYTIPLEDPPDEWGLISSNRGGYMYAAGMGTALRIGRKNSLSISALYRFQRLRAVQIREWENQELTLDTHYNRISIRVGFLFD